MPVPSDGLAQSRRVEGLTYQFVTVAAIVLLLGSLWLF
jgi:hypothetical protein